MTEETTTLPLLLSGTTFLLALTAFYVGRSLWIARREWPECRTDTKVLYLLVAPPLTLAVDILNFTDKLFWRAETPLRPAHRRRATMVTRLRPKTAFRS